MSVHEMRGHESATKVKKGVELGAQVTEHMFDGH